jgi:hypothetical protein
MSFTIPGYNRGNANPASHERPKRKYAFIKAHRGEFDVRTMCDVSRGSFYEWLQNPVFADGISMAAAGFRCGLCVIGTTVIMGALPSAC